MYLVEGLHCKGGKGRRSKTSIYPVFEVTPEIILPLGHKYAINFVAKTI